MKRVLLLGGTGFIGHHIARDLLEHGYKVRVLARPKGNRSLLSGMGTEIFDGTLESEESLDQALKGINFLVHSAGHYPIYSNGPDDALKLGLQQVNSIHQALEKSSVERFLYVSTLSAVGKYPDDRPEDENAPYPAKRNKSTYCRLKRAMQSEILRQAEQFNTVVVAPTAVFGEGDRKPTSGRLILQIAKGQLPAVVLGKTNVVDVHDVAKGVRLALEKGRTGRVYVLGSENLTMPMLARKIARIAEVKPPSLVFPPQPLIPIAWLSELSGKILGKRLPLLPLVGLHFAIYGEFISSDVAVEEIGYNPQPIDDCINRTLMWFRRKSYL